MIEMQNNRGEAMPILPYPFYQLGRHKCSCGKKFWRLTNYHAHYALYHIVLGDYPL